MRRASSTRKALAVLAATGIAWWGIASSPQVARAQTSADDTLRTFLDTVLIIGEREAVLNAAEHQTIGAIQSMPGSFEDPVRVGVLAGSAVAVSDLTCLPVVGGEEPERTLVLFDGFPLAMPYRFLGAFSLFNPIATTSVSLSASGYSVKYGGAFPAGVLVEPDLSVPDNAVVRADLSLPVSTVGVTMPLGGLPGSSVRAAVRATHSGLIAPFIPPDKRGPVMSFVPALRDAQLSFGIAPAKRWFLVQHAIASDEHGTLQNVERSFNYRWQKFFLGTNVLGSIGEITLQNRLSWTSDRMSMLGTIPIESIGDEKFGVDGSFQSARWSTMASMWLLPSFMLSVGGEISWCHSDLSITSTARGLYRKSPLESSRADPAGYAEAKLVLSENVTAEGGVRLTWFSLVERVGLEPRLNLHVRIGPSIGLSFGYGKYLRSPSDEELLYGFLSLLALPTQPPRMVIMSGSGKDLGYEGSDCWSTDLRVALDQMSPIAGWLRLGGYWKEEAHLILPARYPAVFSVLDSSSFEPSQHFGGHKYGVGTSWSLHHKGSHIGLLGGISFQRSLITDLSSGSVFPASADIPWSLKLAVQYDSDPWCVALTYQLMSGMPTTLRYYLEGTNLFGGSFYFPVWKDLNSDRLPNYRRVDLSVNFRTTVFGWLVNPYVELINLFGWKNMSHYDFGFSDSGTDHVTATPVYNSLPFVPSFGVRVSGSL
jgi:hypothetical protein